MNAPPVQPGDAFRLKQGISDHIWFVAHREADTAVFFNFTSFQPDKDTTCVVAPQDYRPLTHRSVVAYGRGQVLQGSHLRTFEGYGILVALPSIPADLLSRIQRGALDSKFTAKKIKDLIR